jgi:cyclopropane-fatty-acyl-phospholipid synthase
MGLIDLVENGYVPDVLVRAGMRRLCKQRLNEYNHWSSERLNSYFEDYVRELSKSPIAIFEASANEQHYEVPQDFFSLTLGPHLKYSSCYFESPTATLEQAEKRALEITCERAQIKDGDKILELGCGWGSLSLFMAANYPKSRIVSFSNSSSQREFIESRALERGLKNLQVITGNIAEYQEFGSQFGLFDRVVSVEMFEHLKNYQELFSRISSWLSPSGTLFVHIFSHSEYPYPFETQGEDNWMGRYFFTGGQMPSHGLLARFQKDLRLEATWRWSGVHYGKTCDAWLKNADQNRTQIIRILEKQYGQAGAALWFNRWRMFFMACAELFYYDSGNQWGVSHYLFRNGAK